MGQLQKQNIAMSKQMAFGNTLRSKRAGGRLCCALVSPDSSQALHKKSP
jgi:hypothetical protein